MTFIWDSGGEAVFAGVAFGEIGMIKDRSTFGRIGLFLFALAAGAFAGCKTFKDYKAEIVKQFPYNETSSPETYLRQTATEYKQGVQFPLEPVASAKIHYPALTKFSKELDSSQIKAILSILNDSASYVWGEIGTPFFDCYFTFYNKEGDCIGLTDVSFDGQTYSTPQLARMKWGLLSAVAETKLKETIFSK